MSFLKNKKKLVGAGCIIPALIIAILRPFGLELYQSILLAVLLLCIAWWSIGCFKRWIVSLLLLAVFTLFGRTPLKQVYMFPLSDNFLTILFSFFFCRGVMSSGVISKLMSPLLKRFISGWFSYAVFILVCNLICMYLIPQPFARVMILAAIFKGYLDNVSQDRDTDRILMFAVYAVSIASNMMLLQGDIIVNYSAMTMAGLETDAWLWIKSMALPSFVLTVIIITAMRLVFKKELRGFSLKKERAPLERLTRRDIGMLTIIGVTVLLCATEAFHGLQAGWIMAAASVVMLIFRYISWRDWKCVNYDLLLFLTAAFSIGVVMKQTGIANAIFTRLSAILPSAMNIACLLLILLVSVIVHMLLGSSVTSLSVLIAGLASVFTGSLLPIVLTVYIACYSHYILPFHNVMLLVGDGQFTKSYVMRMGCLLTAVIPAAVVCLYIPWWMITGVL
jgi:sodium-dependent dicarboxylate transporter 2/3/5